MKNKLNQDQVAMIIADWLDGELSTCDDLAYCSTSCPLNKKFMEDMTICQALEQMAEVLNKEEK